VTADNSLTVTVGEGAIASNTGGYFDWQGDSPVTSDTLHADSQHRHGYPRPGPNAWAWSYTAGDENIDSGATP